MSSELALVALKITGEGRVALTACISELFQCQYRQTDRQTNVKILQIDRCYKHRCVNIDRYSILQIVAVDRQMDVGIDIHKRRQPIDKQMQIQTDRYTKVAVDRCRYRQNPCLYLHPCICLHLSVYIYIYLSNLHPSMRQIDRQKLQIDIRLQMDIVKSL